jgi:hypothetical protein
MPENSQSSWSRFLELLEKNMWEIKSNQKDMQESVSKLITSVNKRFVETNDRITAVDKDVISIKAKLIAIFAIVSFVLAMLGNLVGHYVKAKFFDTRPTVTIVEPNNKTNTKRNTR